KSYLCAGPKRLVTHGIPALIQAMDVQIIPIATAAKIAKLPQEKQITLLTQKKKEIQNLKKNLPVKITEKYEIFGFMRNPQLFEAEKDSRFPLRIILLALLSQCNETNCFHWDIQNLQKNLFCYLHINFEKMMNILEESGWIQKFQYAN